MQNQDFDELEALSIREVAALVHVSRPTVEKWIKNGELLSVELGGCRRVMRSDLKRFMELHRRWGWEPLPGKTAGHDRRRKQRSSGFPEDSGAETVASF